MAPELAQIFAFSCRPQDRSEVRIANVAPVTSTVVEGLMSNGQCALQQSRAAHVGSESRPRSRRLCLRNVGFGQKTGRPSGKNAIFSIVAIMRMSAPQRMRPTTSDESHQIAATAPGSPHAKPAS
jgi:hypothetical protein